MKPLISVSMTTSLIAIALTAGCDSNHGPTSDQAGKTLRQHITSLLSGINARNITITMNEASKNGCKKGKEKYLYSIKATKRLDGGDTPSLLVNMMTGQLSRIARYDVMKYQPGQTPTSYLHDKQTHTNLTLHSPQRTQIEIVGATDCLDSK